MKAHCEAAPGTVPMKNMGHTDIRTRRYARGSEHFLFSIRAVFASLDLLHWTAGAAMHQLSTGFYVQVIEDVCLGAWLPRGWARRGSARCGWARRGWAQRGCAPGLTRNHGFVMATQLLSVHALDRL